MGGLLTKLFFPRKDNNNSNYENTITEISDSNFVDNDEDEDDDDTIGSNEHVNSYEDDDTIGSNEYIDSDDENISLVEAGDDTDTNDDDTDEMDDFIFTYSNEKKALLIGINYNENTIEGDELNGCVNDTNNLYKFLQQKCSFLKKDITILKNSEATRSNIEEELMELVVFSHENPGSEIWLSYSGHGSNMNSLKEEDLKSEVICPSDYATNGVISDYWLLDVVKGFEKTTKLFVLMDCCNSGSNLNLPYRLKQSNVEVNDNSYNKNEIDNLCKIIKISGCEDDQTSADYFERNANQFQGALTNAFLHFSENMEKNKNNNNNIHYLYHNILSYLSNRGFTQHPVLSFSRSDLIHSKLF